jgi:hypothetical protein
MATYNYSKKQLYDFLNENTGYAKWGASRIKKKFASNNLTEKDVRETQRMVKNDEPFEPDEPVQFNDPTIEQAFDEKLDSLGLERSDVKSYKYWETHDGKARFSIEPHSEYQLNFSAIEDRFYNKFGSISTPEVKQPPLSATECNRCDVLGLHDAHIDKVVLADETGYDTDDTIEDNVDTFEQETLKLLRRSKRDGVNTVFIPVGSDFWTVNDDRNTTKRGTKQRVIVPFQKSFEVGSKSVIRIIRWAAENFHSVKVPVIYGNHDEDLDFFLGMLLEQAFDTTDHVEINRERKKRKYYRFGKNGFMFAHGYNLKSKSKMERLPINFAEEATEIWSQTKRGIRKAFLGDIHNEEQYNFLRSKDSIGMNVQFMRGISNSGKYEWDNGYTGVPKTAYLWRFFEEGNRENVNKTVWW